MLDWIKTKMTFIASVIVLIAGFVLIYFGIGDVVKGLKGDSKDWVKVGIGVGIIAVGGFLIVVTGASLISTATSLGNSIPK